MFELSFLLPAAGFGYVLAVVLPVVVDRFENFEILGNIILFLTNLYFKNINLMILINTQ